MNRSDLAPNGGAPGTLEQIQSLPHQVGMEQPLRFALPKGRLADDSLAFLERAGLSIPTDTESRKLVLPAADGSLGFVLAKPRDVPTYVEHGAADLGICGLDVVRETERAVYEPLLLPFGHCRLSVAGPADARSFDLSDSAIRSSPSSGVAETPLGRGEQGRGNLAWMSQPRIATEFPRLTRSFFAERGVNAEIITLRGSVELGPILGLADLIVDIVQTGTTLRMNGLVEIGAILQSQAVLVVNRTSYQLKAAAINRIIERMRVLTT